eukprot:1264376-Rhodomonas_salina.2
MLTTSALNRQACVPGCLPPRLCSHSCTPAARSIQHQQTQLTPTLLSRTTAAVSAHPISSTLLEGLLAEIMDQGRMVLPLRAIRG